MQAQLAQIGSRYYDRSDMFDRMQGSESWSYAVELGITVFLILLFITLAYVLLNRWMDQRSSSYQTPLEIAENRYAKGEISREEFQEIRKELRS